MPRRATSLALFALLLVLLVGLPSRPAVARLDSDAWREVQELSARYFGKIGHRDTKAKIVARLIQDGERRSWKILVNALITESEVWVTATLELRAVEQQIDTVQAKPMAKRFPAEQEKLREWQTQLGELEAQAREQTEVLGDITKALAEGPDVLRKNLFARAKSSGDWPVRAAAARVAAVNPDEAVSFAYLSRAIGSDKDPRVRMAALEALRSVDVEDEGAATADSLILGGLADKEWGVQLLAVRLVAARKIVSAIPHLINALSHTSPRVAQAMGEVLREFTGQNFDPYADVWGRWWEEHKGEYESDLRVRGERGGREHSDIHFYGVPIRSDRVLFIIDASASMKLKTENENPAEKWRDRGPVTGEEGAPPPPPEEILSGPKIDVAKHELKKAIKALPRTARFNIIAFNSAVLRWKDGIVEATAKNKADALTWVRTLQPRGSTYIDGALRLGFRMAGLGAMDKAYPEVNIDTIVLLSDGAPTDDGFPNAKLMDTEVILQHVREWNRYQRVVVHTVGVDIVEGIEFLQKLAAENGGAYVDR